MKTKTCHKCGRKLTVDMFSKNKSKKDGYQAECKKCKKKYREDAGEKEKEVAHKYYKRNKEKISKQNQEWKAKNKERDSELKRRHYLKNIELWKLRAHIRNEKNKQTQYFLTTEQWENVKKHFDYKCCYCEKELPLAREHFIPLSKDGEFTINNILPSCKSCNSSKNNKDFFEWYPQQEFYSKARERKILNYLGYTKSKQQQLMFIN